MTKNKKTTDKNIVDRQIEFLANNFYKDKNISLCNKIRNDTNVYGHPYFIKEKNYEQTFLEMLNKNDYFILLKDQSIINICYTFDNEGSILRHTLSYIPVFGTKTYLRMDYNFQNEEAENNEPLCHVQLSTLREDCRIPSLSLFMPCDFLYFILKYFYSDNTSFVNSLEIGCGTIVDDNKYKIFISTNLV